jgi:predicted permease
MSAEPRGPPRIWAALVERLLDPTDAEVILGDLEEEYHDRVGLQGRRAADRWFRRMALASIMRRWGRGRPLRLRPPLPSLPNPGHVMESLVQDLRFGLRSLLRRKSFTVVVLTTLTLAVGANVTIFALVDGILLEPLPFERPDELVVLGQATEENPDVLGEVSLPNFDDWRALSETVPVMASVRGTTLTLTGVGDPDVVTGALVSDRFFEVFGAGPVQGRSIERAEARPGGPDAVVLSHDFWRDRLGADPGVVGSRLELDGTPYTIVGIAPEGFAYPARTELWIGEVVDPETCGRGCVNFSVVGRLQSGTALGAAREEFRAIANRIAAEHGMEGFRVNVVSLGEVVTGDVRQALHLLLGAVALVLLIACANIANLLLANAWDRRDEMAVRSALGAGQTRIVKQLLVESGILAGVGGIWGLGLGATALRVIASLPGLDLPRLDTVAIDGAVLLFTSGVAAGTVLLFGIAPAVVLARQPLASGRRGSTSRSPARPVLVATQVALSLVLFLGTGLLLRTAAEVTSIDLGFGSGENVRILGLAFPPGEVPSTEEAIRFHERFREELAAAPGVVSLGAAFGAPLSDIAIHSSMDVEGWARPERPTNAGIRTVTPNYLETLDIALLAGRPPLASDVLGGERVAWINETAAREWFGSGDAIGRRIDIAASAGLPESEPRRIVGVVGDTRFYGPRREAPPEVYVPHAQNGVRYLEYFVETRPGAAPLLATARAVLDGLGPRVPIRDQGSLQERVRGVEADARLWTLLLSLFALIAVALASVGIFGVVGYQVSQRRREIGLRMAVGATGSSVVALLIRQGLGPAAVGLCAGLLISAGAVRSLEHLLFGVAPTDPLTWAAVSILLLTVVVAASLVPSLKAVRIDPAKTLRTE